MPVRSLGREFFHHDERAHALVGEKSGLAFRLGDRVLVRVDEATPLTGGLRFSLIEGGAPGTPAARKIQPGRGMRKQAKGPNRGRRR